MNAFGALCRTVLTPPPLRFDEIRPPLPPPIVTDLTVSPELTRFRPRSLRTRPVIL